MKPLLKIATPELIEKLFQIGNEKHYEEGSLIFSEGEKAEFLPIVLSGKVKMVRFPEVGKELILGFFTDGEMFAIPPAMDGKNYPATCVTIQPTRLLIIPRVKFLNLMQESNEFSAFVVQKMCGLLRETAETIQNLATSSPEHRVGNILLRLIKSEDDKNPITIKVRRQDIAEMAGLTTETTIRTVKKLAEKNLLKIIRGKIIVDQPDRLREFLR